MLQTLRQLLVAYVLTWLLPLAVAAEDHDMNVFTTDHPLVYEDKWDMWPYAFLDEQGQPTGFNIDLVKLLMNELKIPYHIVLKPGKEVRSDVLEGRAHLTFGLADSLNRCFTTYSKSVVQLFTHSVVSLKRQPVSVRTIDDLKREKVVVYDNSCTHRLMKDYGWEDNAIPYVDMKEAIVNLINKKEGQIVWNTASLEWLLRIYNNDNLRITDFEMPVSKYRMVSPDTVLLARLDSAFAVICADGKLDAIQNKWFYPNRQTGSIPMWLWYVAAASLLVMCVVLFYNLSYRLHDRKLTRISEARIRRLSLILKATNINVWLYDVAQKRYNKIDPNGQFGQSFDGISLMQRFKSQQFVKLREAIDHIINMESEKEVLEIDMVDHQNEELGSRNMQVTLSVLTREQGRPHTIIGVSTDITDLRRQKQQIKERRLRYQTVFSSAMVDMVYFDEHGLVTDMNERAQQTFQIDLEGAIREHYDLERGSGIKDVDPQTLGYYYVTRFLDDPNAPNGTMYYELQLVPVYDDKGKLLNIYGSGLDVTETARAYHHIQNGIRQLENATEQVSQYVKKINYALGVSGVRLVTYSPHDHLLRFYSEIDVVQLTLTQARALNVVCPDSKWAALHVFDSMDKFTTENIESDICTQLRINGRQLYLHFDFIPNFDKNGEVKDYFGLCRDTSEIKEIQQLLEKESERAQEVESLKSHFLHNMSFEIRTPLNSVVGFSELFKEPHSPEEEAFFISEIKRNSAYLLRLINDILFISRLDAHMIEINKQPVDFSKTFGGHCEAGWGNAKREGVHYVIESPYDELVVDIDDVNVGRIIEQITANAAHYTKKGLVQASYDYIGNALVVTIRDTGEGMSQEVLSRVFERFVSGPHSGTGLGLPICQELASQLGGHIDISSEEGKGTTVWVSIPATLISSKKQLFEQ